MLIIDGSELCMALKDNSGYCSSYLDRKTGEMLTIFEESTEEENVEVRSRIEEDSERYIYIDPIESRDGFRIMEDFVDQLPEAEAKALLGKVLSWAKPFANFKNALYDYPDVREQWFKFHDNALMKYAQDWLSDLGVNAILKNGNHR